MNFNRKKRAHKKKYQQEKWNCELC